MPIRIMFAAPQSRPPFIGHEIEDRTVISFAEKKAHGYFGKIVGLPADPKLPGERFSSEPFEVSLTDADLLAISQIVLTRAGEQGVGGMAPTSIVRID